MDFDPKTQFKTESGKIVTIGDMTNNSLVLTAMSMKNLWNISISKEPQEKYRHRCVEETGKQCEACRKFARWKARWHEVLELLKGEMKKRKLTFISYEKKIREWEKAARQAEREQN